MPYELRVAGSPPERYDTAEEAEAAARDRISERQEHGAELSELTTQERAFILRIREQGLSIGGVEKLLTAAPATVGPMLPAAVEDYLKSQEENDTHHLYALRSKFKKILAAFPGVRVGQIRAGEIERFLRDKGRSKLAYYRVLKAFFNFAVMHDWTEANPILRIPRPAMEPDEKVIYTPEQMSAVLKAAHHDPVMLRLLVFGGFFGLRYKEIRKLMCSDVSQEEVFVRKMKTGKRGIRERYVTALPNAKEWLKFLKLPSSGPVITVNEKNLRLHREEVLKKAKQTWPYNVLRRSFGSYHLAAFENPGLSAAQMGHTDPETTISKYRSVRRKADGEAWFAITPESVWDGAEPEAPEDEKFRPWTKEEEARLGTGFDRDVAAAINRTLHATRARRASLGIPAFELKKAAEAFPAL